MTPLVFVWPYAVAFWAIYLWAFLPEWQIIRKARDRMKKQESKDDLSLRVIASGMQTATLVAFGLPFLLGQNLALGNQPLGFWCGIVLLFGGSLLRRHCWRVLGEYFTGEVTAKPDQPVISKGAYRWVRHPSYTAGIIMMAGIGLALGNWASVVLIVGTAIAIYMFRARVDERVSLTLWALPTFHICLPGGDSFRLSSSPPELA
jgi:protein-S-isoprenylcysteine O-methyltransferase Ste14